MVCVNNGTPTMAPRISGSWRSILSVAIADDMATLAASLRSMDNGLLAGTARNASELT